MKMEFDITKMVEEIVMQAKENQEEFIFETIRPYCENILQMKINKKELKQILLNGIRKQQPCENYISREAVNTLIDELATSTIMQDILDLPSVTPKAKWIPVSERLPEETGYYLVTLDHGTWGLATVQGEFDAINNRWNYDRVIAWMPFPEPYKAESEGEN